MKDIEKRIAALEREVYFKKNEVCILSKTVDGRWQMHIDGKLKIYDTEAEGIADYEQNTGDDSVLIIWDI